MTRVEPSHDDGDLIVVEPAKVLAWRTSGWAGRDSFQATGCWVFDG